MAWLGVRDVAALQATCHFWRRLIAQPTLPPSSRAHELNPIAMGALAAAPWSRQFFHSLKIMEINTEQEEEES